MLNLHIDEIIRNALREDISNVDLSTEAIYWDDRLASVELIAKEDGIIAGLEVFRRVFEVLAHSYKVDIGFDTYAHDGDEVTSGDVLMVVTSSVRVLLSGERVALNILQRMSGIATYANKIGRAHV